MEALLSIRIRVQARDSLNEIRSVQSAIAQVDKQAAQAAKSGGMSSFFSTIGRGLNHLESFGKNLQWVGRQLEFSFTLPLLLAGGLATKWALDNEAAMTRVRKVYGDGTESAEQLDAELTALSKSFELLSNRYGVNRAEVIKTAEAWAQAGSAGVGLARNVQNSLQFSIVAGLDLQKSTEALIATQAIFGYSSEEMAVQLAYLNSIENQTAIDMGGLVDVLERAGGAARGTGIDIRHLSALAAALVPAAGSASKAGNSLRTIISRIFAPTEAAKNALASLGINIEDTSWLAKNGAERLEVLAEKTQGLTQNQEALIASTLGSRYQFNQFMVLMRDIANAQGYYNRALEATSDAQASQRQYAKEITTFLESNPQRFKILTTTIQNFLADAILPLLPALVSFLAMVTRIAKAFSDLDPGTQQFIITMLAVLAIFGPLIRYVGAFALLFSQLGKIIMLVATKVLLPFFQYALANFQVLYGTMTGGAARSAAANRAAAASAGAAWIEEASAVSLAAEEAASVQVGMAQAKATAEAMAAGEAEAAWLADAAVGTAAAEATAAAHVAAGTTSSGAWIMAAEAMAGSAGGVLVVHEGAAAGTAAAWFAAMTEAAAGYTLFGVHVITVTASTVAGVEALLAGMVTSIAGELGAGSTAASTALVPVSATIIANAETAVAAWLTAMDVVAGAVFRYTMAVDSGNLEAAASTAAAANIAMAEWTTAFGVIESLGLATFTGLGTAHDAFVSALLTGNHVAIADAWFAAESVAAAWTSTLAPLGTMWVATVDGIVVGSIAATEAMVLGALGSVQALTTGSTEAVGLALTTQATWVSSHITQQTIFIVNAAGIAAQSWVMAAEAVTIAWGSVFTSLGIAAGAEAVFVASSAGVITVANIGAATTTAAAWTGAYSTIALEAVAAHAIAALAAGEIPLAAIPASVTTTTTWLTAFGAIGTTGAATSTFVAGTQAAIPAAAVPAAAGTAGIWTTAWTTIGAGATALWGAISGGFTAVVGVIGTAVAALAAAIGLPIWATVALIIAAIAALVAVILYIFNEGFRKKVNAIFKSVGEFIVKTFEGVWRWFQSLPMPLQWLISPIATVVAQFQKLPQIIKNIFIGIIRIIGAAITKIRDMLSYLNPFARHSPSLVDNVTNGMDVIVRQYARIASITSTLNRAAAAHRNFIKATSGEFEAFDTQKRAEQRQTVAQQAPQALGAFDIETTAIVEAKRDLLALASAVADQESVVKSWEMALDSANDALDKQQGILDVLEDQLDAVTQKISDAEGEIDRLASTDLVGMRAAEDQIFANEQAQKALRLEILRMEEAGQTVQDLQDKYAALQGDIETLRAEQESLRDAGAGSDVLDTYDAMIDSLQEQQNAIGGQVDQIDELQKQLEELQRQGEMMDLEKSLTFDGPLRQIDQMAEGLNELPYDEIIAKIAEQQAVIAQATTEQEKLNAAVVAQQAVVDQALAKRDEIAAALEREKSILDTLKDAYDQLNDLVSEMESQLDSFVSGLEQRAQSLKETFQDTFDALGEGDFEVPGGDAIFGREGDLGDIEAFNEELQRQLEEALAGMGTIDPFAPIRDAWEGFKGFFAGIGEWIADNWDWLAWIVVPFYKAVSYLEGEFGVFSKLWNGFVAVLGFVWNTLMTVLKAGWNAFVTVIGWVWNSIGKPIVNAIVWFFQSVLLPIFNVLGEVWSFVWNSIIVPAVQLAWSIIQPIFTFIWEAIQNYLIPVFQLLWGVIQIVWELISRAIGIAWTVIQAVFGAIWWGVTNLATVFTWLWENVIQPVWNFIGAGISWVWNTIIKPIFDVIVWWVRNVLGPAYMWLWENVIQPVWNKISDAISWAWNNIISPIFEKLKAGIGFLADKFTWLKDHVVQPVWDGIVSIIKTAWNLIATAIEGGANFFIKAFNLIARGVTAIGDALGISIHIDEMPELELPRLAVGGKIPVQQVNGGFIAEGARAIVGEGRKGYPEYVIPTDPQYRKRAINLLMGLSADLGVSHELSTKDQKTVLDSRELQDAMARAEFRAALVSDEVKAIVAGEAIGGDKAIAKTADAVRSTVIPAETAPAVVNAAAETARQNNVPVTDVKKVTKVTQAFARGGKTDGSSVPAMSEKIMASVKESNKMMSSAVREKVMQSVMVEKEAIEKAMTSPAMAAGGLAPAVVPAYGFGDIIDAVNPLDDLADLGKFSANVLWKPLRASVTALLDFIDVDFIRDVGYEPVHMIDDYLKMAQGGSIVNKTPGGVRMIVGEGIHDERVTVEPLRGGSSGSDGDGDTTNNFFGDMSFPNVRDGNDAKEFIHNLEVLVK